MAQRPLLATVVMRTANSRKDITRRPGFPDEPFCQQ
jgi:hypothetical protein